MECSLVLRLCTSLSSHRYLVLQRYLTFGFSTPPPEQKALKEKNAFCIRGLLRSVLLLQGVDIQWERRSDEMRLIGASFLEVAGEAKKERKKGGKKCSAGYFCAPLATKSLRPISPDRGLKAALCVPAC